MGARIKNFLGYLYPAKGTKWEVRAYKFVYVASSAGLVVMWAIVTAYEAKHMSAVGRMKQEDILRNKGKSPFIDFGCNTNSDAYLECREAYGSENIPSLYLIFAPIAAIVSIVAGGIILLGCIVRYSAEKELLVYLVTTPCEGLFIFLTIQGIKSVPIFDANMRLTLEHAGNTPVPDMPSYSSGISISTIIAFYVASVAAKIILQCLHRIRIWNA